MTDLFAWSGELRNNSGELRSEVSGVLKPPIVNGNSGRTGGSLPGSPGTSGGVPIHDRGRGRRKNSVELRDRATELRNEIEVAEVELALANAEQAPYQFVFYRAHEALAAAIRSPTTKQQRLAAYDARMNAGHAWNPSRKEFQRIESWLKALRKELKEVNAELDG